MSDELSDLRREVQESRTRIAALEAENVRLVRIAHAAGYMELKADADTLAQIVVVKQAQVERLEAAIDAYVATVDEFRGTHGREVTPGWEHRCLCGQLWPCIEGEALDALKEARG